MKKLFLVAFCFVSIALNAQVGSKINTATAQVGSTVQSVFFNNTSGATGISVDKKVHIVFFTDNAVDVINDPLMDAIIAKNFPGNRKYFDLYQIIYYVSGDGINPQRRTKYPSFYTVEDNTGTILRAWAVGIKEKVSVLIIIGKDSKIKYIKSIKRQAESKAEITTVLKVIQDELAK